MSNRLSFFISVFVVALVVSVSFVQLFTENTSGGRTAKSIGAQAADFSSSISAHAITPSDDALLEGSMRENSSVLKVRPGSSDVYLKFNVSGVSGPVSQTTLHLTQASDAGEGTVTASLGAHSDWTEGTLSANSSPAVVSEAGSLTGTFESSKTYAIDIEGITGNGTYTLILGMEEGGNDVWFSSSEESVSTKRPRLEVTTGGVLLPFEAENALPRGSFTTGSISTASNGGYLTQPSTVSNTTTAREEARLAFNLIESGEYSLWVRMYAPTTSSDAFYVGFNGALSRVFSSVHEGWTWKEVSRTNLNAGTNRISIGPGESDLRIDLFAVVKDVLVNSDVLDEYFSLQSRAEATLSTASESVLQGTVGPLPPEGDGQDGDYYVATNGSDSNPGTIDRPLATLTEAVSRVSPGDTVYFRSGTYRGGIFRNIKGTASNPIKFKSYPGEKVVFDAQRGVLEGYVFLILDDVTHLVIDGFEMVNSDPRVQEARRLDMSDSRDVEIWKDKWLPIKNEIFHRPIRMREGNGHVLENVTFRNMVIHDFLGVGFSFADGVDRVTIENSHLYNLGYPNAGYGIYAHGNYITFRNNILHDMVRPMQMYSGHGSYMQGLRVYNNYFYNNGTKHWWHGASARVKSGATTVLVDGPGRDNWVYNNVIRNGSLCVSVDTEDSLVAHNLIYNCTLDGVALYEPGVTVVNNIIHSTRGNISGTDNPARESNNVFSSIRLNNENNIYAGLTSTSEIVDAGTGLSGITTDMLSNPRTVGDAPDVGPFEIRDESQTLVPPPTPVPEPTPEPEPDPTPVPEPTPEFPSIVGYEAEDVAGLFSSLMRNSFIASSDSLASGGEYLVQPSTVSNSRKAVESAQIPITIAETGDYSLWVRLNGQSKSSDAFYAGFDGALKRIYTNVHGTYVWVKISRTNLSRGDHRISLGYGESGLRIDLFAVVRDDAITGEDLDAYFITESEVDIPPPPPVSERFNIGDEVQTLDDLYVRTAPGGDQLGFQVKGSRGVVVGGPVYVASSDSSISGTHWWQIDYTDGPDGWSSEGWLKDAPAIPPALGFEAEDADYQSVFTLGTETAASGQEYLVQPSIVPNSTSSTEVAQLPIALPSRGDYSLWVRVNAPNASSDAFYAGFNGATKRMFPNVYGTYVWLEVTRENLNLSDDTRISIAHGESGLKIDLFAVVQSDTLTSDDLDTYFSLVSPTPEPEPTPEPTDPPSPNAHTLGPQQVQSTTLGLGTHFASPSGSGTSCTSANPCSLQTAVSQASAGSVVFLRNGTYPLTAQLALTTSGTSSNPVTFESYPGERAIIDGQNNPGTRVRLGGNYIVLRNVDVTRMTSSAGVYILNGSNNLVDGVHSYNNRYSGFGIYTPYESYPYTQGSNNIIRNCVAYGNSDVGIEGGSNGGDSDGVSISSGDNNKVLNCLVYGNSDDGIDAWRSTDSEIAYNIVHSNGLGGGDGNGIKSGGAAPSYGTLVHHNISYNNRATGIDQNSGVGLSFFNNVSWDNNYGYVIGSDTIVRNNVSLGNTRANSGTGIASNNTWNSGFSVSSADFESTSPTSDFFFVLKPGSNLVNAGVSVGLSFEGSAPDIGAVELNSPKPEPTPEPTPEPEVSIVGREAEDASPHGSFITESISSASNETYLVQPSSVSNTSAAREDAQLSVSITESGEYSLWVRMYAPATSSDAFYAGFNGTMGRIFPSSHGEWVWKEVSRANLSAGANRISIGPGEAGLQIDLFAVVRDSSVTARDLDEYFSLQSGEDNTTPGPTPEPTNPISRDGSMGLRGDPSFSQSNLSSELRTLYDAFWGSLSNSYPNLESASSSSNQYNYGRTVYQGMFMISTAFRQTGDLNLLDRMYELNKNMYDQLSDSWISGTVSPYYDSHVGKNLLRTDGYRNWRYSYNCTIGGSDRYCGRDNHRLEESLSHGMVAATMYALHVNRDLESPKGYNYGEMADRWLEYLRGDFEAKWRERYDKAWPEMPYFSRYFTHTNIANLKTNYYVGLVLKDKGDSRSSVYLAQAERMANEIFDEPHIPSGGDAQAGGFVETSTPLGTAYIWAFGTPYGYGTNSVSAAPTTYARYFLGMAAELHFDGMSRFNEDAMRKLSRTVAYFILDTDPPFSSGTSMLAADVVGGDGDGEKYVSGMQSTSYRGRNNANRYAISTFGVYGLWDSSGRINRITDAVYGAVSNRDRLVQLNGSRFITAFDETTSSNE